MAQTRQNGSAHGRRVAKSVRVTDGFRADEKPAVAMLSALMATGHPFSWRPTDRDHQGNGSAIVKGWALFAESLPSDDAKPLIYLTTDELYGWLSELSAFAPFAPPVRSRSRNGTVAEAEKAVKAAVNSAKRFAKAAGITPTTTTAPKATPRPKADNVRAIRPNVATPTTPTDSDELPDIVTDWLDRLIYEPKRAYARAYCHAKLNGAPAPEDTGEEWQAKARKRADRVLNAR